MLLIEVEHMKMKIEVFEVFSWAYNTYYITVIYVVLYIILIYMYD